MAHWQYRDELPEFRLEELDSWSLARVSVRVLT
jgi:hypothetical protein